MLDRKFITNITGVVLGIGLVVWTLSLSGLSLPTPSLMAGIGIVNLQGDLSETPCLPGYEYEVVPGLLKTTVTVVKSPAEGADPSQLPAGTVRFQSPDGSEYTSTCDESNGNTIPQSVQEMMLAVHAAGLASQTALSPAQETVPANTSYTSVSNTGQESFSSPTTFGNWNQTAPPDYLWSDPKAPYSNIFDGSSLDLYPWTSSQTPTFGNSTGDWTFLAETDLPTGFFAQYEQPTYLPVQSEPQTAPADTPTESPTSQIESGILISDQFDTVPSGTQNSPSENQFSETPNTALEGQATQSVANGILTSEGVTRQIIGDGTIAYVSDPVSGQKFYDNDTGKLLLEKPLDERSNIIIHTSDGIAVQTSKEAGAWTSALAELDTPQKYKVFEALYLGSENGESPVSYTTVSLSADERVRLGIQDGSSDVSNYVSAESPDGSVKIISLEAYNAVRAQGDIANGTDLTIARITEITGGKAQIDSASSFPDSRNISGDDKYITQPNSEVRAKAISIIETEINKYPASYWNSVPPVTYYVYGEKPESIDKTGGGYSNDSHTAIWVNADWAHSDPAKFALTVHHEMAHQNEQALFGSSELWGTAVYGDSYGKVYAGLSGAAGIVDFKLLAPGTRPIGFPSNDGKIAPEEDQAKIVDAMFTNYPALQEAATTDPILEWKMTLAKMGYCNVTKRPDGGCDMDEAYWQNLKPIDSSYKLLPIAIPNGPVRSN